MPNLFAGINLSLQALLSQQAAVEIIEHNVANVNTPGYRRQEAVLKAGTCVSPVRVQLTIWVLAK